MKPAETLFEETMWLLNRYGYMFFLCSHKTIEDYNVMHNVILEGCILSEDEQG